MRVIGIDPGLTRCGIGIVDRDPGKARDVFALRDADGAPVPAINNPAHVFSMPCPHQVPINAAIRSRTKKPTLKAE